ncbi:uncharacterized protein BCR38DRAFT_510657 [Pseudomassariella vexata]|uniref:Uncharacterized protein n=1 Tax=Pseudomassariella vexata TaxID=1141098 RepID=A0A1Y2E7J4_9PEZI|nr:uncharacterized protein BCR38DRAFT_510657 [Pseudomassariella vexata]ORY67543.1 hypothetical protein BCR38DRAFT_510657 [Pseudomassariella vexata]
MPGSPVPYMPISPSLIPTWICWLSNISTPVDHVTYRSFPSSDVGSRDPSVCIHLACRRACNVGSGPTVRNIIPLLHNLCPQRSWSFETSSSAGFSSFGDSSERCHYAFLFVRGELQSAEEKVLRLRKQKKMWFEKMMRAVRRGIDSVEELERVDRAEAEALSARRAVGDPSPVVTPSFPEDFEFEWNDVYPDVSLTPGLLAEFGVIGGTSQAPSGNAPNAG